MMWRSKWSRLTPRLALASSIVRAIRGRLADRSAVAIDRGCLRAPRLDTEGLEDHAAPDVAESHV